MKRLLFAVMLVMLTFAASPTYAQIKTEGRKVAEPASPSPTLFWPKGWDGKVQGMFQSGAGYLHLRDKSDYAMVAKLVVESFDRSQRDRSQSPYTLSSVGITHTRDKEPVLAIKATRKEGRNTAFFPIISEGPQGIIILTNGSICSAGVECDDCLLDLKTVTCVCHGGEIPSPASTCRHSGGISINVNSDVLNKFKGIAVGTATPGGAVKLDREAISREVRAIVPAGFQVGATEVRSLDRGYYSVTSLTNREQKSYLFIAQLGSNGPSLILRPWGFLYHCEGVCGLSIPQCEAKQPGIALNGQLSCGCNGHCAPKFGRVLGPAVRVLFHEAYSIYP